MTAEIDVPVALLRERVTELAQTAEPLGAYATADSVRYPFLTADGVRSLALRRDAQPVPSLTAVLPLYDWHEREMQQTHGIVFADRPDRRPLFIAAGLVPGALTAQGEGLTVVVVGPVHAGIIEPGRFTFTTGGETVISLDAQFSYSRRGLESALAGRDALAAAPAVARICGGCSAARSWAYARALEALAGVACEDAAEYARVVFAELERLYNHLFDLGNAASGAGYGRGLARGLELKERVAKACAAVAGHRLLFDAIVPGGVRSGVLRDPAALRRDLHRLRAEVKRFTGELFANQSLLRRFAGAGVVDADTARLFGTGGPARRASGGKLDVRAFAPYGAYRTLGMRVRGEKSGDVLARCRVKTEEIAESFRLLDDALAALGKQPPGEPLDFAPAAGHVTTAVEGARGIETVSVELNARGTIERLHVISASYRNWPVVPRAMDGNIIPDFPLVNKSFNLCYACMDR
jgi:Ni,Fe-hydrogenase III large subunit